MKHPLIIALSMTFTTLPAIAQQAQPEYTFKLNEADINVISKGLGTQPFAEVAPIMQKMQKQFIDQQPKPKPAAGVDQMGPSTVKRLIEPVEVPAAAIDPPKP